MTEESATNALRSRFVDLRQALRHEVLGQPRLIDRLLLAVLADGHLLVEGAPGLAKTTAIKALASKLEADFHRIQFTPDLLPADLTGTEIYRPQSADFVFQRGPLFHNLILADEVNRAPAKVQSALLEAMGERQITVGLRSYPLPALFLVMATQNPIEQEGTFALPEAQLDRFLMHVRIGYPDAEVERGILALARARAGGSAAPAASHDRIPIDAVLAARRQVLAVHMAEGVEAYLVALVLATRQPPAHRPELRRWLAYGASPRASIALDRCARARAWLEGRDYVLPDDLHAIVHDVLRHRLLLHYEAQAEGIDADQVIDTILDAVPLP